MSLHRFLKLIGDHPRLDHRYTIHRIDLQDPIHPGQI